jgi:hypothetical protein
MSFNNDDWLQMTGSTGFGGTLGFSRPMRDPVSRQMLRPFAVKTAAPPKPKPASAMTPAARAREARRLKARLMELETADRK